MDPYYRNILEEDNKTDTSFTDNSPSSILEFIFGIKAKQKELRDIWLSGKSHGFEMGIQAACPEVQRLQLMGDSNKEHKEFYDKFVKLCQEYDISIMYHPLEGMIFTETRFGYRKY